MGCENTRKKYINLLNEISNNSIDDRSLEDLMINTYFNEKELFFLYKKFIELGPNQYGMISNSQLLEMKEFKFCPFKKFLCRALKLEEIKIPLRKRNAVAIINDDDEEEEHNSIDKGHEANNDLLTNFNANYDNETDAIAIATLRDNDKLTLNQNVKNQKNDKEIINNAETKMNKNVEVDHIKNKENADVKLAPNKSKPIGNQYINFQKFCDVLKIFNSNYPLDAKIRYGDGRISKTDLKTFLYEIFPEDKISPSEKPDNKEMIENENADFDKIIEIIFAEIITNDKRKYIDYDEFSNILWTTSIDKSCVIDLFNEND